MTEAPDCLRCAHAMIYTEQGGKIDFLKKICVRMPPTPVALPAGPNQMTLNSLRPVVTRGMFCGCFEPKEGEIAFDGPSPLDEDKSH